jgi:hypothetical protein
MSLHKAALAALADAETRLQRLIEEGLREKAYDEVARVAEIAAAVSEIIHNGGAHPLRSAPFQNGDGGSPALSRSTILADAPTTEVVSDSVGVLTGRPSSRSYPRFERQASKVIKVGWSARERRAYEHRAPREAAQVVFERLKSFAQRGRTFGMDKVTPLQDAAGKEVPSYQAYLVVAWLRDVKLVHRRGKDGYVVGKKALEPNAFEDLWSRLPERE